MPNSTIKDPIMGRKTTAISSNFTSYNKADAFLRLEAIDADGNRHRLPKDLALAVTNHISEQLINKATADADYEFKFVGKIHVVDTSPKEDVKF